MLLSDFIYQLDSKQLSGARQLIFPMWMNKAGLMLALMISTYLKSLREPKSRSMLATHMSTEGGCP